MSETTATTNESLATPLTTSSNEWELEAATAPNKDLCVLVGDPMFTNQTVLAVIRPPDKVAADAEGRGKAVRLSFEIKQELVSTDGVKKAPGYIWKPRFPSVYEPASQDQKDLDQAERGLKDLYRLAIAAGALTRKTLPTVGNILRAVGELNSKPVMIKFVVKKGSKRNDDGEFPDFQNVSFSAPATGSTRSECAAQRADY